jgi:hypothetical protein
MTGRAGTEASEAAAPSIAVELIAVLVAVADGRPLTMTIDDGRALPSGPFEVGHRAERAQAPHAGWRPWYDYFPWEDHRSGAPALIGRTIAPALDRWAESAGNRRERRARAAIAFGLKGRSWNEELALQRYELLYEAGLIPEAARARPDSEALALGEPMIGDHRRILATGIARVRAKIKYNPVVFELMAPVFTLLQLQRCVEAIAGLSVHKPNFRRLIEQQELVEETGETVSDTGGRPATAFRFRPAVREERAAGTKLRPRSSLRPALSSSCPRGRSGRRGRPSGRRAVLPPQSAPAIAPLSTRPARSRPATA